MAVDDKVVDSLELTASAPGAREQEAVQMEDEADRELTGIVVEQVIEGVPVAR
jgi:hypothetical protein